MLLPHVGMILAASSPCDCDDLQWRLTVADDGALAENGILPILIEWPDGRNPAHRMADSLVRLSRLV